jgi:hypothetical protein
MFARIVGIAEPQGEDTTWIRLNDATKKVVRCFTVCTELDQKIPTIRAKFPHLYDNISSA